ncbi:MAG: L,D-transpeptidase [Cyanobacteria bacterium]|nr:L,D-transpeptidase [Cyanobacteriota bacterium]MDW8201146.1 L,D-transpeptidase [Cyanobacteriota bacterium SKYGB_h_bin112]
MRNESLSHSIMMLCMVGAVAVVVGQWQPLFTPSVGVQQRLFKQSERSDIRIVVDLSDRRVYLHHQQVVKASYPIAVGQKGWETPTGRFMVLAMQEYPTWQHPITGQEIPPGKGNPLGARWIKFTTADYLEIGFHGTEQENTIGQAVSHGCIRMRNSDIIQLYDQIKLGTIVEVRP